MNRWGPVGVGVLAVLFAGLTCLGSAQEAAPAAAAPAKAKSKKKALGDKYKKSKYFAIVPNESPIYKYGPDGKPVQPPKKKRKKAETEAPPPEDKSAGDPEAPQP